tara:strand:+ start:928 stop:1218 length:291 start_codon:yes stop_codon:yes gene_type:complete
MSLDHEAIRQAYPSVTFIDEDGSVIQDAKGKDITVEQSKIDAARKAIDDAYAGKKYQRDRKAEYPTWQDQLDKIYHSGIDAWKADIKAIKDKYPKS